MFHYEGYSKPFIMSHSDGEHPEEVLYTYGDGDVAADRLVLVAEFTEQTTRTFLSEGAGLETRLALDLGSGLGHTTHLIAEVLKTERVIGVERSANFLSKARTTTRRGMAFVEHDVTQMPLPYSGEADLIYARLLLSHLLQPEAVIEDWTRQLVPGGLLLLEEVELIRTEHPVFGAYLGILEEMMAHYGQEFYVGPRLDAASEGPERRMSRVVPVHPTTGHAAKMFSLNLSNWRDNEFVRANHSQEEIDHLAAGLSELITSPERDEITWGLRQIALARH